MTQQLWKEDDGLTDVTSAFKGITHPLSELVDDIHRRGWTVNKIYVKDGTYVALGKSPHKETIEATGRTDATAAANLLVKIMRREFMRGSAVREKLGAWDHRPFEQQLPAIAQAYAGAPVYQPKAATAWMELAQDCGRRAMAIRLQISVEIVDDPVPYESTNDMREDVTEKRHVMITRAYAHHPVWSEQQMIDYRLVVDTLGHTVGGADWGWHGTCMAFAALAPLFADVAQKALYTELLGQTAFGTFYRQWGPQKICFLEDLVEKAQKENKPGHSGVHPSQSIVPMATPSVFSKVAMAERSGNPELDAAIYEFMSEHRGELGNIQDYRHPQVAWGQCEVVAQECAQFLQSKGFKAYDGNGDLDELGYQNAQKSEDVGAGDFTYPEHSVVCIYNEHGVCWWTIDFTAAQYGYEEFPKVEPGPPGPLVGPQQQTTSAVEGQPVDPNGEWESGVQPLPDAAYLWQRENGVDPLDSEAVVNNLLPLDTGIANQHPQMAKQSVVSALRGSLLGSRNNPMGHAIHYQDLMHVPADVDDPIAYWDALEQRREAWNQAKGYAPGAHKQYWPEEQMLKQWVKGANPEMDDGDVQRLSKREMLHMLTEEEERIIAQDQGEQLSAEVIQHEAYEALRRRLGSLTKGKTDQKVDFGTDHLFHEAAGGFDDRQIALAGGQVNATISYSSAHNTVMIGEWTSLTRGQGVTNQALQELRAMFPGAQIGVFDPETLDAVPYWQHQQSKGFVDDLISVDNEIIPPKTATHHADMYPPYLASRLRPIAHVSRHADALAEAAREDLVSHKGHGHHFRAKTLSLGIPQLGPRQVSNAWLHLAPQTSALAVINPEVADMLGHNYEDMTTRDYFKGERELAAGRDAAGYGHVPLGAFSAGMYDLYTGGQGWHPDRTAFKVQSPTAPHMIDWTAQATPMNAKASGA